MEKFYVLNQNKYIDEDQYEQVENRIQEFNSFNEATDYIIKSRNDRLILLKQIPYSLKIEIDIK